MKSLCVHLSLILSLSLVVAPSYAVANKPVEGLSESLGEGDHVMLECGAAQADALNKAGEKCKEAGLSGKLSYAGFNTCLPRMWGGQKVKLHFRCSLE